MLAERRIDAIETLTSVVSLFAHRDVTLGVVPSGAVNSFSRNLGIEQSFEGAAALRVMTAPGGLDRT